MTKRLVSGIQPTGRMHLGNYLGAIQNWVNLQEDYDSFFMIADLHAMTTLYDDPEMLRQNKHELTLDLLGAGVDPSKACLFNQSDVSGHSELHVILSMMTPLGWLERVPTYKDKKTELQDKDISNYGFLGYPVLQAADILLYQGEVVPVGKDQLPHLELTREIVRRVNFLLKATFVEPQEILTEYPMLLGTDGRKMSKSYGNTIPISSSEESLLKLILSMKTDPNRVRKNDPGNPDVCAVFSYHRIFNDATRVQEIDGLCRSGDIGCVDCKKECGLHLNESLSAFRQRRQSYQQRPDDVKDILDQGAKKASEVAAVCLKKVQSLTGLTA